MKIIEQTEGTDSLGSETATVTIAEGDFYVTHTSYRRGGCLYAGFAYMRNVVTGASKEVDLTSRASGSPEHCTYLASLAAKHVGDEQAQLASMTDREAAAYWNILQMDARMIRVGDDGGKHDRHVAIMGELLTDRGIAHERDALTVQA